MNVNNVRLYDGGDCFVELLALHQSSSNVVIQPAESQQQASGDVRGRLWMIVKMKVQAMMLYCEINTIVNLRR